MVKVCWKCGEYHPNGTAYCPFCGTSLDERKRSEGIKGLFVFEEDKPLLLRLNHRTVIPAVILIVAVIIAAAVILNDSGGDEPVITADCTYNYRLYFENPLHTDMIMEPYVYADEGYKFVVLELVMVNNMSGANYVYNGTMDWEIELNYDGELSRMDGNTFNYYYRQSLISAGPGESASQFYVFQVKDYVKDLEILNADIRYVASKSTTIALDPKIDVPPPE